MRKFIHRTGKNFGTGATVRLLVSAIAMALLFIATAVSEPTEGEWTFAAISDTQGGYSVFTKILEGIRDDPDHPELMIHSGDIAARAGDRASYRIFFNKLSILGDIPFYGTPGNHDVNGSQSHRTYLDVVKPPGGKSYYYFEHKNAFFVCLDANMPGELRRVAKWQRLWLIETLEKRDPDKHYWTFVFFHMPIFPQGMYKEKNQPLIEGEKLHEVFRHYRVTAVFNGHEHMYKHFKKDGVNYYIIGGSGGRLYKGWGGEFHHWLKVAVSDTKVVTKAIDIDRHVRDIQTIYYIP